jgi:polyisoprenoid-binding protein YceI
MLMTRKTVALAVSLLASTVSWAGAQAKPAKKTADAQAAVTRFIVAPTGNEARYRVREQLVSLDLPNDAVGVTRDITGALLVNPNGSVVTDSSRIVVNVAALKSDKDRRDAFIKKNTMETAKYPTVTLVPKSFVGLTAKPGDAPCAFDIVGDLTVHGVTRPVTWKAIAHSEGEDIVGTATTEFTFKDFSLDQPKVSVLLSVEDTIKLEYDFRFTPASKGSAAAK